MRRPSRASLQPVLDVGIPVAVALFLLLVVGEEHREEAGSWERAVGSAVAIAQGGILWWRRTHPELVLVATLGLTAALVYLAPETVIPVGGLFAVFSLAATRSPPRSILGLLGLLGVTALNFLVVPAGDALFAMALVIAAWALGEASRSRRVAIAETARLAVADEQARIARELHDVIAHGVSVIVVQAAAADEVFDRRPDQARAALQAIETAARDALRELRLLLADVRPDIDADAQPQPGLDRLDELAAPLRAAGLEVAVHREGDRRELPAGVDLSAYRIVQEALTNTLRHAHASRADVTVRYAEDAVELDVRDDGRGTAEPPTAGHGLTGMRERVAMLGGTLEVGPLAPGGFRVHARLPLEAAR